MMKSPKGLAAIGLAVFVLVLGFFMLRRSGTEPEPAGPPIRVLFIGSTYLESNDLPGLCARLVKKGDRPLEVESVLKHGYTLDQHWKDGDALAAIRSHEWDFVVLQDQSDVPLLSPLKSIEVGKVYAAEIKKAGAQMLLFITWTKKNSIDRQDVILATNTRVAQETDSRLIPAGPAWVDVGPARAMFYRGDESHPTPLGSYLAACVCYAVIRNETPEGLPFESIVTEPPWSERPIEEIRRWQALAWKLTQKLSTPPPLPPEEKDKDKGKARP